MQQTDRTEADSSVRVFGASTPLRAKILSQLGHKNVYISSLEVSALLGEKDDESIGFDGIYYFASRIRNLVTDVQLYVDCDTGWSEDQSTLEQTFTKLNHQRYYLSIQNLRPGEKENSFNLSDVSNLADPVQVARRLNLIRQFAPESKLILRLENLNLGQTEEDAIHYLYRVLEAGGTFDAMIPHSIKDGATPALRFAERLGNELHNEVSLMTIATAYAKDNSQIERFRRNGYGTLIFPNYSLRSEITMLSRLYGDLIAEQYSTVEESCLSTKEVLDMLYS